MGKFISNYDELPLPNKRIYDLVQSKADGTVATFAEMIGVTQQVLDRIFKKDKRSNKYPSISEKIKDGLKKAFGLDEVWLLTGNSETLKDDTKFESPIHAIPPFEYDYTVMDFFKDYYSYLSYKEIEEDLLKKQLTTLTDEESAKIAGTMGLDYEDFTHGIDIVINSPHTGKLVPVYNAKAAAGKANIDMYGPRSSWINVGDLLKDSEASLYVYGNSMIPGYPPGSLIGIRPLNESFIEPGSVYVVETESNRYIKRLYYSKDKTALICMSDNHIKHTDGPMEGEYFYPPFEIPLSSIRIIYKVIGVIKRNSISLA